MTPRHAHFAVTHTLPPYALLADDAFTMACCPSHFFIFAPRYTLRAMISLLLPRHALHLMLYHAPFSCYGVMSRPFAADAARSRRMSLFFRQSLAFPRRSQFAVRSLALLRLYPLRRDSSRARAALRVPLMSSAPQRCRACLLFYGRHSRDMLRRMPQTRVDAHTDARVCYGATKMLTAACARAQERRYSKAGRRRSTMRVQRARYAEARASEE